MFVFAQRRAGLAKPSLVARQFPVSRSWSRFDTAQLFRWTISKRRERLTLATIYGVNHVARLCDERGSRYRLREVLGRHAGFDGLANDDVEGHKPADRFAAVNVVDHCG